MEPTNFSAPPPANEPFDQRALVNAIVEGVVARLTCLAPPVLATTTGDGDVLTVAEAAKLVKLSPETIRDWIHAGKLRAGKRPYRVIRRDLLAAVVNKATVSVQEEANRTVQRLLGRT